MTPHVQQLANAIGKILGTADAIRSATRHGKDTTVPSCFLQSCTESLEQAALSLRETLKLLAGLEEDATP